MEDHKIQRQDQHQKFTDGVKPVLPKSESVRQQNFSSAEVNLSVILVTTESAERILNRMKYCLDNIENVELLIVVNENILSENIDLHNVKIINYPTDNYGLAACRNYGALFALGKYITFIDDDSIIAHNFSSPVIDSDVSFGSRVDLNRQNHIKSRKFFIRDWMTQRCSLKKLIIDGIIAENNMIIKRKVFLELGGFITLFPIYGIIGQEFLWRLALRKVSFSLNKNQLIIQETNYNRRLRIKNSRKKVHIVLAKLINSCIASDEFQCSSYRVSLSLAYKGWYDYPKLAVKSFICWLQKRAIN